ncbi:hypothetical protein BW723_01725 [Polaribacter reichenbachii]|uniref:Outer membrane protein beta-barrel domain-containing protein n=1 Tax=Polaribacter reichenbachii TaxID=996801 RepID=A0A1B8TWC3_9FLAO|nr:hypothetical protein [Polaribacter reichenbachii]APZ45091.1 hypothetical protein BW723_01725 [Polaribacter reichenbachii]AUC18953.1 hypothetical protein BTO17_09725 [Polaribacter reichenbachii]OBY63890.1 hypothetical protein LPB301_13975 [Polaribacter reichenbachii]
MKKIILTFGLLLVGIISVNAQSISDNAIGLRFGGGDGVGGEISYQKALGSNNRLEIDLGLANEFSNFKATGLYEWVWNLEEQFNWYAGFGGGIISANGTGIYGSGVIGLEYDFDVPILLSIDYRPEIGIAGGLDGLNSNVALSVRYQF